MILAGITADASDFTAAVDQHEQRRQPFGFDERQVRRQTLRSIHTAQRRAQAFLEMCIRDSLYSMLGETNAVDAASYLEALCRDLIESVQKENDTSIALKTDIASESLPVDRAIPLGLIVNELVTNAVKYAFPGEPKGTIAVTLKRFAGELRLTVADDGQGADPQRADSGFGGRLVDSFARQLSLIHI